MASAFFKWLFLPVFGSILFAGSQHPFHVSVVEINHNAEDKTLEITCKIFTDDF